MKAIIPFLCLSVLLSATGASAQQFINGSFEPAGTIPPCADTPLGVVSPTTSQWVQISWLAHITA
ncbi:MAG: hypothetical protein H3C54_10070 [Taibaiella sp.]|nr:hypothetical protein [Taibaiella sp.]